MNIFVFVFFTFTMCGVVLYELVRWSECQAKCEAQAYANEQLITSDLCLHNWQNIGTGVCEKAANELQLSRIACTIQSWWRQGEVYRLYTKCTDSYAMLLAIILIPTIYVIWNVFAVLHSMLHHHHHQTTRTRRNERLLKF